EQVNAIERGAVEQTLNVGQSSRSVAAFPPATLPCQIHIGIDDTARVEQCCQAAARLSKYAALHRDVPKMKNMLEQTGRIQVQALDRECKFHGWAVFGGSHGDVFGLPLP